ncbi:MAG TPA: serine/threonine-protein kinase [Urbifossiella sp.]|nr:serine/threonine-protein kinase [Urbifossiella sp.]
MLRLPPRFTNLRFLGAGGMGTVYRATLDGVEVAVKVPTGAAPADLARFARDWRVASAVRHDHVVRLIEVGGPPDADRPYYAMEFLGGGSLRSKLEDYRGPGEAVALTQKLVAAVRELHRFEWSHGDLNPNNVLFGETGPKLVDFGLARPVDPGAARSASGGFLGTQAYIAPELLPENRTARPTDEADRDRIDVYSLGVMLYEMLTGRTPPGGGPDWRPSRFNRAVRGWLDQLVMGCLQQRPARRYTLAQLAAGLAEVAEGRFPARPAIPVPAYQRYTRGRIALTVAEPLAGGDGVHRYRAPDGIVVTGSATDWFDPPDRLADTTEDWLRTREDDAHTRKVPFENRRQPRVAHVGYGFTAGRDERLHPLVLRMQCTDYYTTVCSHAAFDLLLPDLRTVREAYAGTHDDFDGSFLANPLATNLTVVTTGDGEDRKTIYLSKRGKMVGINPDFSSDERVPAVSGTGHPVHDAGPDGVFDPFRAAVREAREEVLGTTPVGVADVTFFGLARTGATMFPFLFGEIRLPITRQTYEQEVIVHRNDVIGKEGRPFTVEAVTAWIRQLYHRYNADQVLISGPSHTGIFGLYQSLIYEYPDEVGRINDLLALAPDAAPATY